MRRREGRESLASPKPAPLPGGVGSFAGPRPVSAASRRSLSPALAHHLCCSSGSGPSVRRVQLLRGPMRLTPAGGAGLGRWVGSHPYGRSTLLARRPRNPFGKVQKVFIPLCVLHFRRGEGCEKEFLEVRKRLVWAVASARGHSSRGLPETCSAEPVGTSLRSVGQAVRAARFMKSRARPAAVLVS